MTATDPIVKDFKAMCVRVDAAFSEAFANVKATTDRLGQVVTEAFKPLATVECSLTQAVGRINADLSDIFAGVARQNAELRATLDAIAGRCKALTAAVTI